MKRLSRQIVMMVAVVALVAALAVCFCACNGQGDYAKRLNGKGYAVTQYGEGNLKGLSDVYAMLKVDFPIKWAVRGTKTYQSEALGYATVIVIRCARYKDAKAGMQAFEADTYNKTYFNCVVNGKILIIGTMFGILDAKDIDHPSVG